MKKLEKQVANYLAYCRDIKKLSPNTLAVRSSTLLAFAREIPAKTVSQISNAMIENWTRSGTRTGSTINEYTREIKTMLRFFIRSGVKLKKVNFSQLARAKETPRRRVFYLRPQIEQVLKTSDELEELLICLSFECGFRIHELASLRLKNLDGRRIFFLGKGRKLREVYMSKTTRQKLNHYIRKNHIRDHLWMRRCKNGELKPLSKKYLDVHMRRAFVRAGFLDFYPHSLRHSFATEICLNGAPLEAAKEMLGHSDIKTTIRYVHSLEGRLEELFEKYRFSPQKHR